MDLWRCFFRLKHLLFLFHTVHTTTFCCLGHKSISYHSANINNSDESNRPQKTVRLNVCLLFMWMKISGLAVCKGEQNVTSQYSVILRICGILRLLQVHYCPAISSLTWVCYHGNWWSMANLYLHIHTRVCRIKWSSACGCWGSWTQTHNCVWLQLSAPLNQSFLKTLSSQSVNALKK